MWNVIKLVFEQGCIVSKYVLDITGLPLGKFIRNMDDKGLAGDPGWDLIGLGNPIDLDFLPGLAYKGNRREYNTILYIG